VPPIDKARLAVAPLRLQPVRRLTRLYIGLIGYGVSSALVIRAGLGSMPWDVFHQGLARRTGISIGVVSIVVGAIVLLFWIPLRQRPGFGTLSNVVVVGAFIDIGLSLLPPPSLLMVKIAYLVAGIVFNAVASALYIGARLGPGPRDGLMTGLATKGLSVRFARTGIEVVVVVIGFLLGGTLGLGTLAYAVSIGPLVQLLLPAFLWRGPAVASGQLVGEQVHE
jgi:uncharacterized membrane protein YczE